MKKKWIMSFVAVICAGTSTHAACGDLSSRTFNGDEAVTLTYIFKNSTIATKSTSGNTTTWSLSKLQCGQTNRGVTADLMPAYNCSSPSGVGPITAKALWDAMSEMGVMPDGATGHVYEYAKSIKCKVNKDGSGGEAINPRCTLTAAWGDECG